MIKENFAQAVAAVTNRSLPGRDARQITIT
jgi:hypothetical protein